MFLFCNYVFGVHYFMQVARNSQSYVYCSSSIMLCYWKPKGRNRPPSNQVYIVTVCCHVYCKRNCTSTFTVCQTDDMQYNADTGITDHTSSRLFCVVRRLAIKPVHLLWSRNVKIWGSL